MGRFSMGCLTVIFVTNLGRSFVHKETYRYLQFNFQAILLFIDPSVKARAYFERFNSARIPKFGTRHQP
jgi:hypothetical protein